MNKQVCYYPGSFNPPTKYHLNTAYWLESRENVSQVIIVLGQSVDGELSQDTKYEIWETYLKNIYKGNIKIVKSEKDSPLKYIYDIFKNDPESEAFIALDQSTGRDKMFTDKFDQFKNYQIQLIPSQSEKSSEKMLLYANQNDFKSFKKFLPNELPQKSGELCMDLINEKPMNEVLNNEIPDIFRKYYMESMNVDKFKNKNRIRESIYSSGEYLIIENDIKFPGILYEAAIDINDHYEYEKESTGVLEKYKFKNKDGDDRICVYNKTNNELKLLVIDSKTGKETTDNSNVSHDPKVMNTFVKIIKDEILSNNDKLDLYPEGAVRYRFFRAILMKYSDKDEWDIETDGSQYIYITRK